MKLTFGTKTSNSITDAEATSPDAVAISCHSIPYRSKEIKISALN